VDDPCRMTAKREQSISSSSCASTSAISMGRRGWNGLQEAVHVRPAPLTQRQPDDANRRVCLEDIRRYVRRGVLREEDGWVREEEDRTMRREEVRRMQIRGRGGMGRRWGSPMLGVVRRNLLLERGDGARRAGVWNAWGTRGRR
jgi:hypothetical protein